MRVDDDKSSLVGITFIGFNQSLVSSFLKTCKNSKVTDLILITSKGTPDYILNTVKPTNREILEMEIEWLEKEFKELRSHSIVEINNIWQVKEYMMSLRKINPLNAIINVSSGPAAYSVASTLFAIINGLSIAHSIETEYSITYSIISMKPFSGYTSRSNYTERLILNAIEKGNYKSTQIKKYLHENGYKVTLRTVEEHLSTLTELNILNVSKGKNYLFNLSEDLAKLGLAFI